MPSNRSNIDLFLGGFVCACILVRLALIGRMPIIAAESYYWGWSKDLAWGYFDHPPMIAYVIRLTTLLGGDTEFYVRLGPWILNIFSTIVLFGLAKGMFGTRTALVVCSVIQIIPFFAAAGILSVPDSPLSFFWILTVYFIYRSTMKNDPKLWYAAGVSLGLALMSKYHAFLLIPSVLLYLASSRNMRRWLVRREPYLALGIGFLVFLPNLFWNAEHRLTTFRFLLVERHGALAFSINNLATLIAGFLAFLSPLFGLLSVRLFPRIGSAAFMQQDDRYLLLLSTSLPPILFFGLLSPWVHVGAHWVATGYPMLCVAVISLLMENRPPKGLYLLKAFPLTSILFSFLIVITAQLVASFAGSVPPTISIAGHTYNLLIWENQKELYGWRELGTELKEAAETMPDPGRTFFTSHDYRFTSHLRFLAGGKYRAMTTGYAERRNQYLIWNNLESLKGWDAIFVVKNLEPQDRGRLETIFDHVGPVEELEISVNHVKVRSFYMIRCYGYKGKKYLSPQGTEGAA